MTLGRLSEMYHDGVPIVMVTAYDYAGARAAERAGVDIILVGDSGAQVHLGYPNTQSVSVAEMLMLTAAVRRGTVNALVVTDLPFGSVELSDEQAVETAIRFVREAGADAVKIEGGNEMKLSRIRAIVAAGIPVMGHVGLTPQTATALGGLKAQGRTEDSAKKIAYEAVAVQSAGAFSIVFEAVPTEVTNAIASELRIPVIGIGAGPAHGQVLVQHDLLGITEGDTAKFVHQFAQLGEAATNGIRDYATAVRSGSFPSSEHQYTASSEAVVAAQHAVQHAAQLEAQREPQR